MKIYFRIILFFLISSLFFGCSVKLPGDFSSSEYADFFHQGDFEFIHKTDFSFFNREQLAVLGNSLSFSLAVILIEEGRNSEAEHILTLFADSEASLWTEPARQLILSSNINNHKWNSIENSLADSSETNPVLFCESLFHQGKDAHVLEITEIPEIGEEMRFYRSVSSLRLHGKEGFEDFFRFFYTVPCDEQHTEAWEYFLSLGFSLEDLTPEEKNLALGKLAFLKRDWVSAEKLLEPILLLKGDDAPGVLEDMITLYRRRGKLLQGAETLISLSGSEYWGFPAGAGRLLRWAGRYKSAADEFLKARDLSPDNEKQRMLWYLQDCRLRSEPGRVVEIINEYAPEWEDADYFSDSLDLLISRSVREKRWSMFSGLLPVFEEFAAADPLARLLYITSRLIDETVISPESIGQDAETLRTRVISLKPRGYYRYLAAAISGFPVLPRDESFPPKPEKWVDSSDADRDFYLTPDVFPYPEGSEPVLNLLTDLGFYESALNWYSVEYSGLPSADRRVILKLAAYLQEKGEWLDSIRLLAQLPRNNEPEIRELQLLYPRGYLSLVEGTADEYSLPPALIFGLAREESGFTAEIESWAGALGLLQLMPSTAADVASRMELNNWDLFNPSDNLTLGAWYFSWLLDYVGGTMPSLLAYNGGPGRIRGLMTSWNGLPVDIALEGLPMEETRRYGPKVLVSTLYYGYLYYQISPESTLEWFFPDLF